MFSLFYSNLQINATKLRRKFFNSLFVVESPSIYHEGFPPENSGLDPLNFFNKWINSTKPSLKNTKSLHTHLLKCNFIDTNRFIGNSLVDCYCKSAHMGYASKVFDQIPQPNTVSWNILIAGYKQNFMSMESWRVFSRMHSFGYESDQYTYGSVLSACSAMQSSFHGKLVYSLVMKNGFFSNGFIRAGMIGLLSENGNLEDALRIFHDFSCDNVVCWNAIISGAVKNKENWIALDLFSEMCRVFVAPNSFTFSSIVTACAATNELELGKAVQGWAIKCDAGDDIFVGTATIDMYAKCGEIDEAVKVFKRMPLHNVVSWTTIISGFVQNGHSVSALQFFNHMKKMRMEINNYTITSLLIACADYSMLREAMQMHCWLFKSKFYSDHTIIASLVNMYSKMGEIHSAEKVFEETEDSNRMELRSIMVSAFVQNGSIDRAIDMFLEMFRKGLRPDKFCTSSVLSIVDCLYLGRQIHCYSLKAGLVFDVSVGSSLFTMYSKCGNLADSYEVFQQMVEKDIVSWASMISGFAEHGCADQSIQLFREVLLQGIKPDEMTIKAVLNACSNAHYLNTGKEIHGFALRKGFCNLIMISGALVNMYSKCGSLARSRKVFDLMPRKDQISCSSLVSGYVQNGCIEEGIQLFRDVQMANIKVDSFMLSSVFGAVYNLNRLGIGVQLHAHTIKIGLESEASVGSSLVMMYSKFGNVDECKKAFEQINYPDLISWTAMITSYAQNGQGVEALNAYKIMRDSNVKPDAVTFVGVLSACSHNGLVEEGYFHLNSMVKDYGIKPGYRHYACMVDLLGRAGRLKEAEKYINDLPIKANAFIWGTLLAACKMHGDVELGKIAARKVIELDPYEAGAYVTLSNIWADVGEWEEVMKIRHTIKGTEMKKDPGWSYV